MCFHILAMKLTEAQSAEKNKDYRKQINIYLRHRFNLVISIDAYQRLKISVVCGGILIINFY